MKKIILLVVLIISVLGCSSLETRRAEVRKKYEIKQFTNESEIKPLVFLELNQEISRLERELSMLEVKSPIDPKDPDIEPLRAEIADLKKIKK